MTTRIPPGSLLTPVWKCLPRKLAKHSGAWTTLTVTVFKPEARTDGLRSSSSRASPTPQRDAHAQRPRKGPRGPDYLLWNTFTVFALVHSERDSYTYVQALGRRRVEQVSSRFRSMCPFRGAPMWWMTNIRPVSWGRCFLGNTRYSETLTYPEAVRARKLQNLEFSATMF